MRKIFEQEKQGKVGRPEALSRDDKQRVEKGINELKDIVTDLVTGVPPASKAVDGSAHAQINDLKRIVPSEMSKIAVK